MRSSTVILFVVFFVTPWELRSEQIAITAIKDNAIFSESTNSAGAATSIIAGRTGGGGLRRGLLEFDVASSIPAAATVTSAALTLRLEGLSQSETESRSSGLHRITAGWGEGSSGGGGSGGGQGAAPTPEDATWLHRSFDVDLWSVAGGDFDPTASSTTLVGTTPDFYSWPSTADLVNDVQAWLDGPSTNFGWILIGDESSNNSARRFASREAVDATLRPTLMVEYTAIPEPSSVSFAIFAMLCLTHFLRRTSPR